MLSTSLSFRAYNFITAVIILRIRSVLGKKVVFFGARISSLIKCKNVASFVYSAVNFSYRTSNNSYNLSYVPPNVYGNKAFLFTRPRTWGYGAGKKVESEMNLKALSIDLEFRGSIRPISWKDSTFLSRSNLLSWPEFILISECIFFSSTTYGTDDPSGFIIAVTKHPHKSWLRT